jgi:hypothetical protein
VRRFVNAEVQEVDAFPVVELGEKERSRLIGRLGVNAKKLSKNTKAHNAPIA